MLQQLLYGILGFSVSQSHWTSFKTPIFFLNLFVFSLDFHSKSFDIVLIIMTLNRNAKYKKAVQD